LGQLAAPGLVVATGQAQYSSSIGGGNQLSAEGMAGLGGAKDSDKPLFGARVGGGVGFTHNDSGDSSSSFSINANVWGDMTNRGAGGGFQITTTFGLRLGPL
jgi:hypothetical protein